MANQASKLKSAQKAYKSAESGGDKDTALSNANHSRAYDPSKQAERATSSQKLNEASSQYRGAPGNGQGGGAASPKLNEDAAKYRSEK